MSSRQLGSYLEARSSDADSQVQVRPEDPFPQTMSKALEAKASIRSSFSELADDVLLTEHEAAAVAGFGQLTFKRWRQAEKGPPWVRIIGGVRYRKKALTDWLANLSSDAA